MNELIYCPRCREFFECNENDPPVCLKHQKDKKELDIAIKDLIKKGVISERKFSTKDD
jgi:hypothetical protein